jgi:hypothetical protein
MSRPKSGPEATESRIWSAVLCHTKGLGFLLWLLMKAAIAAVVQAREEVLNRIEAGR